MRFIKTMFQCAVCGSTDTTTDHVAEPVALLLGECAHCAHRWTARPIADDLSARAIPIAAPEPRAS